MAKLYKMTLYVCDLEGDLDLEQIKELLETQTENIAMDFVRRGF